MFVFFNILNCGTTRRDSRGVEPREGIRAGAGEDYKYSSAPDYAGEKGLLDNVCVFQYFKL